MHVEQTFPDKINKYNKYIDNKAMKAVNRDE